MAAIDESLRSKINRKQVEGAVHALFSFINERKESKTTESHATRQQLFEDESYISIIVTLFKLPSPAPGHADISMKPFRIPIPHTLFGRSGNDICLITKDPSSQFKELLENSPVSGITNVIGVSELKKDYRQFEDKRRLCSSYSLFLADDRVMQLLPPLLGKVFYARRKHPIPVSLKKREIGHELALARDSTFLFIPPGSCCAVKVATSAFQFSDVIENIFAAIPLVVSHIPRKWKNINSIFIKTPDSIALPIYSSLSEEDMVLFESLSSSESRKHDREEDEKKKGEGKKEQGRSKPSKRKRSKRG